MSPRPVNVEHLEDCARLVGSRVERVLSDGTRVTVTLGDISGDGRVDEEDFELLRRIVSDGEARRHVSPQVLAACDLDGDGVVDVRDLLILLSALLARTRELARQDDLTGLDNRRAFREKTDLKIETARRYGVPMCCLAMDLDHFKDINDTYGHPAGDAALRTVADILRHATRGSDVVCRFGGDEFLALLDHLELDECGVVVDRIMELARETRVPTVDGREFGFSVSVGVVAFRSEMDAVDLVHEADQALYRAKRAGRGRVELS